MELFLYMDECIVVYYGGSFGGTKANRKINTYKQAAFYHLYRFSNNYSFKLNGFMRIGIYTGLLLFLFLGLTSCKLDNLEDIVVVADVEDEFYLDMWEELNPDASKLQFRIATIKQKIVKILSLITGCKNRVMVYLYLFLILKDRRIAIPAWRLPGRT